MSFWTAWLFLVKQCYLWLVMEWHGFWLIWHTNGYVRHRDRLKVMLAKARKTMPTSMQHMYADRERGTVE